MTIESVRQSFCTYRRNYRWTRHKLQTRLSCDLNFSNESWLRRRSNERILQRSTVPCTLLGHIIHGAFVIAHTSTVLPWVHKYRFRTQTGHEVRHNMSNYGHYELWLFNADCSSIIREMLFSRIVADWWETYSDHCDNNIDSLHVCIRHASIVSIICTLQ